MLKVGILAIHGSVTEHANALRRLEIEPVEVRSVEDLEDIEGLIIPGGESTTISDLAESYGLKKSILKFANTPKKATEYPPILGTCAGLILLTRWSLLDVKVARNAYGRQIASFEAKIVIASPLRRMKQSQLKRDRRASPCSVRDDNFTFHAVFIRAPKITKVGRAVEVMAEYDSNPVLVRQKNIWGVSFHPELTDDNRIHKLVFDCHCEET